MPINKPLESLLEETKQELEDILTVLGDLKNSIKEDINSLYEVEIKKLNQLKKFLEDLQGYLNSFKEHLEDTHFQISETNEKILNLYQSNLQKVEETLSIINEEINELLSQIENSAYKGVKEGLTNSLYEVKQQLSQLESIANNISKALNKQRKTLEDTFKKYQWSWLGPFLFTNLLLFSGIIYIGLQNADREKVAETLINLVKLSFIIFSIFISWEIFKRYISNLWISIALVSFLSIESFLITFITLKDKIQIVHKEQICNLPKPNCNLPKPNEIHPQKDGSICYFYKDQKTSKVFWYSLEEEKWYEAPAIAICQNP